MFKNILTVAEHKIMNGDPILFDEAVCLSKTCDVENLLAVANRIRKHYNGDHVDLCTIMNAKSGRCTENCRYCAQSGHYHTGVQEYALVGLSEVLKLAKENEQAGVHRFSLVTSGANLSDVEFDQVIGIYKALGEKTGLKLCASLGSLSKARARQLKETGVATYHHNVETSRSFFPYICTTHSYDSRIETIKNVQEAGMKVCSGGIIGMGETMEQRIEMAFELKSLGIRSIPVNILNPIKGTPLENAEKLSPSEILKTIAVFRFILPESSIRYAGGRSALGEYQAKGFLGGINAALVGNYLTTIGSDIQSDINMITDSGLTV